MGIRVFVRTGPGPRTNAWRPLSAGNLLGVSREKVRFFPPRWAFTDKGQATHCGKGRRPKYNSWSAGPEPASLFLMHQRGLAPTERQFRRFRIEVSIHIRRKSLKWKPQGGNGTTDNFERKRRGGAPFVVASPSFAGRVANPDLPIQSADPGPPALGITPRGSQSERPPCGPGPPEARKARRGRPKVPAGKPTPIDQAGAWPAARFHRPPPSHERRLHGRSGPLGNLRTEA